MTKKFYGITRGFILPNGEVAKTGTRHDDIALEYINTHNELWNKYKKFRGNLCDFMVLELGAIKVGNNSGNPKVITYVPDMMTTEMWYYIKHYIREGYLRDEVEKKQ